MAAKAPTSVAKAKRNHATLRDLNAFLAPYSPQTRAIAKKARALVLALAPDVLEDLDAPAKLLGYSYTRTYKDTLCVLMLTKAGVNFGFSRGAEMPDPVGLLTGIGKRARHVKLTTVEQVDSPALRALLDAAILMTKK